MDYLDVVPGQTYSLPKTDDEAFFEFVGKKRDGTYVLRHELTGRKSFFSAQEFKDMRFDGRAVRVPDSSHGFKQSAFPADINPEAVAVINEGNSTPKQMKAAAAVSKLLNECRSLRYLTIEHDNCDRPTRSTGGLQAFIDGHWEEMQARGLSWKPSPSALRKALDKYGSVGHRPLNAFIDQRRKRNPLAFWHKIVIELKEEMTCHFYSERKIRLKDAYSFFFYTV